MLGAQRQVAVRSGASERRLRLRARRPRTVLSVRRRKAVRALLPRQARHRRQGEHGRCGRCRLLFVIVLVVAEHEHIGVESKVNVSN